MKFKASLFNRFNHSTVGNILAYLGTYCELEYDVNFDMFTDMVFPEQGQNTKQLYLNGNAVSSSSCTKGEIAGAFMLREHVVFVVNYPEYHNALVSFTLPDDNYNPFDMVSFINDHGDNDSVLPFGNTRIHNIAKKNISLTVETSLTSYQEHHKRDSQLFHLINHYNHPVIDQLINTFGTEFQVYYDETMEVDDYELPKCTTDFSSVLLDINGVQREIHYLCMFEDHIIIKCFSENTAAFNRMLGDSNFFSYTIEKDITIADKQHHLCDVVIQKLPTTDNVTLEIE